MKFKKIFSLIFWILFIGFFVFGIISFIYVVAVEDYSRDEICRENNGVSRGTFRLDKCINESGVYEIVQLNGTWRLIK